MSTWFYEMIEKRPPKRQPLQIELEIGVLMPVEVAVVVALAEAALAPKR